MPDKLNNFKLKTILPRLDRHEIALISATLFGYCVWNITYLINASHVPWDGALPSYILFMFIFGSIVAAIAPRAEAIFIGTLIGQLAAIYFSSNEMQDEYVLSAVGSLAILPGIMFGSAIHENYITEESQHLRIWVSENKHYLQFLTIVTIVIWAPSLTFKSYNETLVTLVDSKTKKPIAGARVKYEVIAYEGSITGHGSGHKILLKREGITNDDGQARFEPVTLFIGYYGWSTSRVNEWLYTSKVGYEDRSHWAAGGTGTYYMIADNKPEK